MPNVWFAGIKRYKNQTDMVNLIMLRACARRKTKGQRGSGYKGRLLKE